MRQAATRELRSLVQGLGLGVQGPALRRLSSHLRRGRRDADGALETGAEADGNGWEMMWNDA